MFDFRLKTIPLMLGSAIAALFCSCQQQGFVLGPDRPPRAVVRDGVAISLRDQKLMLFRDGKLVRNYDVSTSKFGIGSRSGSNRTPKGIHAVTKVVGAGQPSGMVFKSCRPTGEVLRVNARGRDSIVTRVIQIAGLESRNQNSYSRRIYIHGTPEERKIGRPASYGCIRMRSRDVMELCNFVNRGTPVAIETCSTHKYLQAENDANARRIRIPENVIASLPSGEAPVAVHSSSSSKSSSKRPLSSSRKAVASNRKGSSSSKGRSVASTSKKGKGSASTTGAKKGSSKKPGSSKKMAARKK